MADIKFRTQNGIIPALDLESFDAIRRVVEETCEVEGVVGYKLGIAGALRLGLNHAVRAIREITDLPILYDHQKAGLDIPDMAKKFCAICQEAGVDALVLFPLAGPTAVEEFIKHTQRNGLCPIVGGDFPMDEYKVSGGGFVADDGPSRIMELAVNLGVRHFIVPSTNLSGVQKVSEFLSARVHNPTLFMTGIGTMGGRIRDAFAAAGRSSCYAIVGRAVYANENPKEAAKMLGSEALLFA
ncbi:orotidine 5'-phosphate decarboxylase / HUMPS family protein [Bacillus smithii]|uniref:orotidine 5'-phosphate decarboxylase / HUMPS family protein n=1 Tax=Bacillus smithii TaxID=1479 RepID=UPI002E1FC72B|nr:orotidine 5'-phosphate decarboxylase [Bacillus smithii]